LELNRGKSERAKDSAIELLSSLASGLRSSDVGDFLTLSNHYSLQTPTSYRRLFESALFGSDSLQTFSVSTASPCRRAAMNSLCMPVSAEELLNSIRGDGNAGGSCGGSNCSTGEDAVKFFVVDCRPHQMYNNGHLPTAFHLDCGLVSRLIINFVC
jgi:hypothetical protein